MTESARVAGRRSRPARAPRGPSMRRARRRRSFASPSRAAVAGRDQRRVVPGQLRERPRQLLQPAVVGEAAVVERTGRAGRRSRARRRAAGAPGRSLEPVGLRASRPSAARSAVPGDDAVVHRRAARTLSKSRRAVLALPVLAHEVVARSRRAGRRAGRQDLVRRLAVVERRDQRLDDRRRAVVGARVAPRSR